MTNQYNLIKVSLGVLGLSLALGCLCLWGLNSTTNLGLTAFFRLGFAIGLIGAGLASLVGLVPLVYCLVRGNRISDLIRSLYTTYRIRRYAHFIPQAQTLSLEGKPLSTTQKVYQRANRSLLSLNVIIKGDKAVLSWYLPLNHESKQVLLDLLPNIRTELNLITKDFVFSDITSERGNQYQAKAHRIT
ncbi:hypothetical protein [uncultured Streptococcus sp.]|uniref:hypothetical protein n=1 Tax=uncultured Streptococcus sp. TaxID=83427 RepID=UPI0027DB885D|nr:hypothetical protein [uncultured Streptococcus sp.]